MLCVAVPAWPVDGGLRPSAGAVPQAEAGLSSATITRLADPRNALRTVARSAERVGIEQRVGVHSLRHTDIRMTANTYGHVSDATARAAMDALGTAMGDTGTQTADGLAPKTESGAIPESGI